MWILPSDWLIHLEKNWLYVAPLTHFKLTSLCPYCLMLSRKAANTNLIVFCLTWQGLKFTIYSTQCDYTNHLEESKKTLTNYLEVNKYDISQWSRFVFIINLWNVFWDKFYLWKTNLFPTSQEIFLIMWLFKVIELNMVLI
jgi:hypothetical protein